MQCFYKQARILLRVTSLFGAFKYFLKFYIFYPIYLTSSLKIILSLFSLLKVTLGALAVNSSGLIVTDSYMHTIGSMIWSFTWGLSQTKTSHFAAFVCAMWPPNLLDSYVKCSYVHTCSTM